MDDIGVIGVPFCSFAVDVGMPSGKVPLLRCRVPSILNVDMVAKNPKFVLRKRRIGRGEVSYRLSGSMSTLG